MSGHHPAPSHDPRSASSETAPPLLTACVSASDDGFQTVRLVSSLLELSGRHGDAIEVLLSTRPSSAAVGRLLKELRSPLLRIHERSEATSPDHQSALSLSKAGRGRYIWFVPAGAEIDLESLAAVLPRLREETHACFFFNSEVGTVGEGKPSRLVTMSSASVSCEFTRGALALGLTTTFSELGSAIQWRSNLMEDEQAPRVGEFAFPDTVRRLEVYAGTQMAIVNLPLVSYRLASDSDLLAQRQDAARRSGEADHHLWTTGTVATYAHLQREGLLSFADVAGALERRRDGTAFRAIDNVLLALKHQVLLSLAATGDRNRLPAHRFEAIAGWLLEADAGLRESVGLLKAMFDLQSEPRGATAVGSGAKHVAESPPSARALSNAFDTLLRRRLSRAAPCGGSVEEHRGYVVYQHLVGVVAIRAAAPVDALAELARIDPVDQGDDILVGLDQDELRPRIARAARMRRPGGARREPPQSPRDPSPVDDGCAEEASRVTREGANAASRPSGDPPGEGPAAAGADARARFLARLEDFTQFVDIDWYAGLAGLPGTVSRQERLNAVLRHLAYTDADLRPAPNAYFDEAWYLDHHDEAKRMQEAGEVACGFDHYILYGLSQRADPGPAFSEAGYGQANADVSAALSNCNEGFRCGFEHWLLHGRSEGRDPLGTLRIQ